MYTGHLQQYFKYFLLYYSQHRFIHIDRIPLNRNRIAADFWYRQISYRCPMNRYNIISWWNQRFTPPKNTKWMLYFPAASDEQLYYSFQGKPRLVVCNQEQVCNALKECHDNLGSGGHPGRRRTTEKVLASYHWKTLREDVKKWKNDNFKCNFLHNISYTLVNLFFSVTVTRKPRTEVCILDKWGHSIAPRITAADLQDPEDQKKGSWGEHDVDGRGHPVSCSFLL